MSRVYLPTSEQMDDTIDYLDKIAGALGAKIDLSSWEGIQKAVKSGLAPELLPVGTQLMVSHDTYGDMVYDVVAHDYLKSKRDANAHTMTLMSHDVVADVQYDEAEAFFCANTLLRAGTYNFILPNTSGSWAAGSYQFTLTVDVPVGGQLCIDGHPNATLNTLKVVVYASRTSTTATESVPITSGNAGVSLGTFGVELNHVHRVAYGSNNYKESAVRQFLNSSAAAGSVWTPQTKFDRPPSWSATRAGFVRGFDDDLLAVIGEVIVPCSTNAVYESPDSSTTKGTTYTVADKFYLSSQKEILGEALRTIDDGTTMFPYYAGVTNTDRIKYEKGVACHWWLRTPLSNSANVNSRISLAGNDTDSYVFNVVGIAPCFTIV